MPYQPAACHGLDIFALKTQLINIDCMAKNSCRNLDICSNSKDGYVNIDCLGNDTCFNGIFCQNVNRTCSGLNSCKTKSPTMNPTIKPTLSPIIDPRWSQQPIFSAMN